jgi:hypothetical protein
MAARARDAWQRGDQARSGRCEPFRPASARACPCRVARPRRSAIGRGGRRTRTPLDGTDDQPGPACKQRFNCPVWISRGSIWAGLAGRGPVTGDPYFDEPGDVTTLASLPIQVAGSEIGLPTQISNRDVSQKVRYADVMIWFGQFIDPTNADNLAKFISGGRPISPAAAVGARFPLQGRREHVHD